MITKADMIKKIWTCSANNDALIKKLSNKYSYNTLKELWIDARKKERYGL